MKISKPFIPRALHLVFKRLSAFMDIKIGTRTMSVTQSAFSPLSHKWPPIYITFDSKEKMENAEKFENEKALYTYLGKACY